MMGFREVSNLKPRDAHGNPEGFNFCTARNDTAIVIAKHDHGSSSQIRTEDPLAGNIHVIDIDQSDEMVSVHTLCKTRVTTPQIVISWALSTMISG